MSHVQFEDPYAGLTLSSSKPKVYTRFVAFLIKKGWAKDERTANFILIGIILVSLFFIIFYWTVRGGPKPEFSNQELKTKPQFLP